MQWPVHLLTRAGTWTARPAAFVCVGCYAVLWLLFDRPSLDWNGAATLVTLSMALIIQRSQYRDTQAIQAKLDELLRTHHAARNEIAHIDEKEPEEIERERHGELRAD